MIIVHTWFICKTKVIYYLVFTKFTNLLVKQKKQQFMLLLSQFKKTMLKSIFLVNRNPYTLLLSIWQYYHFIILSILDYNSDIKRKYFTLHISYIRVGIYNFNKRYKLFLWTFYFVRMVQNVKNGNLMLLPGPDLRRSST